MNFASFIRIHFIPVNICSFLSFYIMFTGETENNKEENHCIESTTKQTTLNDIHFIKQTNQTRKDKNYYNNNKTDEVEIVN